VSDYTIKKRPVASIKGKKISFARYLIDGKGVILNIKKRTVIYPHQNVQGYMCVNLRRKNGKRYCVTMHRLMYRTWKGRIKDQLNHIDGDKTNYQLDNLEDITSLENHSHARETGLNWAEKQRKIWSKKNREENNPKAKLTKKKVLKIRSLASNKSMPYSAMAKRFGISVSNIKHIVYRRTWRNL